MTDPVILESMTGHVHGVFRVTQGHTLAAAADVGDTVLYMESTSDFDEEGGQVLVSGDVYDYVGIDPDADTLTLATPLSVAAAYEDPVDVFDPEIGSTVVVGYEASVMLDDADPTGRTITVDVQHGLVPMLEESTRGGPGEAVTLVRDGEHDWTIWQVDGKLAVDLLADAALEAAADAADLAMNALTQAELAEAITDGFIDYHYQTTMPWPNGDTGHDNDFGDCWVDTDSNPQVAYRWKNTRIWTLIADGSLTQALFDAQAAQVTADGKIRHYVGTYALPAGPPPADGIAHSYGDIFTKTNEDNREYYWDGNSWEMSLVGDDAIATTLTGKVIQTAFFGNRVRMRQDSSAGVIEGFTGDSAGETYPSLLNPTLFGSGGGRRLALDFQTGRFDPGGTYIGYLRLFSGTYDGSSGPQATFSVDQVNMPRVYASGGVNVTGGGMNVTSGVSGFYDGCSISGGLTINNGGLLVGGSVELNTLEGTGGSSFVMTGNDGVLSRGAPSSMRHKENVKPLDARVAEALLQVDTITWQYKDRKYHGDRRYAGVPAEQLHDLGLDLFVDYDAEGRPDQVRYWELVAPLIALCQSQQAQIDDLTARVEALEP